MSNFSVNGVYNYKSANIYSYLGILPQNSKRLQETFRHFDVRPTGNEKYDLERLNTAMYEQYSTQVQNQIANQNNEQVVPWAGLCAQIGVQATGNYEKDYAAFNNAIQLLSQSATDGQAMAYFAGLRNQAASVFGANTENKPVDALTTMSYQNFQAQFLY